MVMDTQEQIRALCMFLFRMWIMMFTEYYVFTYHIGRLVLDTNFMPRDLKFIKTKQLYYVTGTSQ